MAVGQIRWENIPQEYDWDEHVLIDEKGERYAPALLTMTHAWFQTESADVTGGTLMFSVNLSGAIDELVSSNFFAYNDLSDAIEKIAAGELAAIWMSESVERAIEEIPCFEVSVVTSTVQFGRMTVKAVDGDAAIARVRTILEARPDLTDNDEIVSYETKPVHARLQWPLEA